MFLAVFRKLCINKTLKKLKIKTVFKNNKKKISYCFYFFNFYFLNFIYTEFFKYGKEHFLTVSGIHLKTRRRKCFLVKKSFFFLYKYTDKKQNFHK